MALANYVFTLVLDVDGANNTNVGKNVPVEIRNADAEAALATIYSDADGTSVITQPGATTNSVGKFSFYAERGLYQVYVNGQPNDIIAVNGYVVAEDLDSVALQNKIDELAIEADQATKAQIARLGIILPPIAYDGGLEVTSNTQAYSYDNGTGTAIYVWTGAVPFTTTGAFDEGKWTLIQDLNNNTVTFNFDGIKSLENAPLLDRAKFNVSGFYVGTEVGGGVFVYDSSRDKADHNGGTVIDPDAIAAWDGTQADLATLFTAGTGTGCFVRLTSSDLVIECFGANPQPAVDNFRSLAQMHKAVGSIILSDGGEYETSQRTDSVQKMVIYCRGQATLRAVSGISNSIVRISHAESYVSPNVIFDCNSQGCGAVECLTGSDNSYIDLRVINVHAFNGGSLTLGGLSISGGSGIRYRVQGKNFVNVDQPNESLPRLVSIQDTSTDWIGEYVEGENIDGTLCLLNTSGKIGHLKGKNISDNGIYAGSNAQIEVDIMDYDGSEEAIVAIGGASVDCGMLLLGPSQSGAAISVNDCKEVSVGHLHVRCDHDAPLGPQIICRTRPGNVLSERIFVGKLTGAARGQVLNQFENGDLSYFEMNDVDFIFYTSADVVAGDRWNYLNNVIDFVMNDWRVKFLPVSGYDMSGDVYWTNTSSSIVSGIYYNILIFMPEGGQYRGQVARDSIRHKGATFQLNVGPYAREFEYQEGSYGENQIPSIPTTGYWHAGEDYIITTATSAPFRARCTVAGTPGTWVSY